MPECPKCGKEIDHLINRVVEIHFYRLRAVEGNAEYDDMGTTETTGEGEYCCPECDMDLLFDEAEALAFLQKE